MPAASAAAQTPLKVSGAAGLPGVNCTQLSSWPWISSESPDGDQLNEWATRLNRDSVLQMDRIHAARELEAEVSRGIDARLAAGRFRACESRRALGDKRPVVAKRVRVAGGVAVARLEDDLVVRVREKGYVVVDELAAAEPPDGADGGRRETEP